MRLIRIRTLLLAVALLPLAGLLVFATRDVVGRWDRVQQAALVENDADLIDRFLTATDAIESELTAAESFVEVAALGVDMAFVEDQLGIDLSGTLAPSRERFDQSMGALRRARAHGDSLAEPALVDQVLAQVALLGDFRHAVDTGTATSDDVAGIRRDLVDPLYAASDAQLDSVSRHVEPLGDAGTIDNSVEAAEQAVEVLSLARRETVALSEFLVPFVSDNDDALSELAVSSALLARAEVRLEELLPAAGIAAWQEMKAHPRVQEFESLRDDALAGEISPTAMGFEFTMAARAVDASLVRLDLMSAFAADTNGQVIDEARAVGSAARSRLQLSVIVAGIVAVLTLVGTAAITRSIVQPLSKLEARARRITEGVLTEDSEMMVGPREIAVVGRALSDLTAGLRVLETQAEALSTGDLSASALETTPPGRLGRSLRRSVLRLSELTSRLEHQARHDTLTGLMNRSAGIQAIGMALARAERSGTDVGLLFVDLDGFKSVNDVHGHPVGDQVLKQVAERLLACSRTVDAVARLGGDEFIVVVDDLEEIAGAVELASRIIDAVSEPFEVAEVRVVLSASVGLAWAPRGAGGQEKLMVQADLALYRAKEKGKGCFELFDDHLRQAVEQRAHIEATLEDAIDKGRLELWYQPIVEVGARRIWGVEALVRWRHPDGRVVLPDEFIPIAERSDLILDVDRFVLRRACEQLIRWDEDPATRGLHMSANVSGRHLDAGDLVGDVDGILLDTGLPAERLTVELTETRLIENLEGVSTTLQQLRELALGVAIDDFGTGYSSVAHLRRLPVTRLKIDRTFIPATENKTDRSILELLIWLGLTLGLEVVAEGIETAEQLELVSGLGCSHAQGYLLGRPMPAASVEEWVRHYLEDADARRTGPTPHRL